MYTHAHSKPFHPDSLVPKPEAVALIPPYLGPQTVSPTQGPEKLTKVRGLPGRLVLAAAQPTCANAANRLRKGVQRVEKHQ